MTDFRWAILGAGRIGAGVLPKINAAVGNRVVVIATRDPVRAAALGPTCSYDDLLVRDDLDAVYIALPHHMHAEWSIRLLDAGKHVLCEKPLCATRPDAERIAEAARRAARVCTEGFMYMHHPQTARLVALARPGGPIGTIRRVRAVRNIANADPYILNTRMRHEMQGGALMDLGCYPLSLALHAMQETPVWSTLRASADLARWIGTPAGGAIEFRNGRRMAFGLPSDSSNHAENPVGGFVDESCDFSFDFPSGVHFDGECSFTRGGAGAGVFFELVGDRGRAFTTHPFSPDSVRQVLLIEADGERREEVFVNGGDRFVNQFTRFASAARGEIDPLPSLDWSILEADAIERIHQAIGVRWDGAKARRGGAEGM